MKKLLSLLALLPLLAAGDGQYYTIGRATAPVAAAPIVLPVWSQAVFNSYEVNAGSICPPNSTTCGVTLTVAANDLLLLACASIYAPASGLSSLNGSSSVSATWSQGTLINNGLGSTGDSAMQVNWAVVNGSGSTTVTCTANNTNSYLVTMVYDYTGGAGTTYNTSLRNASATGQPVSTGPFTTTGPTITLYCISTGSGTTLGVGSIGGATATHFLQETSNWVACEDYSTTSNITSGSAGINAAVSVSKGVGYVLSVQ
jgi:hypothetical protein